jgi:hypothetical protein
MSFKMIDEMGRRGSIAGRRDSVGGGGPRRDSTAGSGLPKLKLMALAHDLDESDTDTPRSRHSAKVVSLRCSFHAVESPLGQDDSEFFCRVLRFRRPPLSAVDEKKSGEVGLTACE